MSSKIKHSYQDAAAYLAAYRTNPDLAGIPVSLAADYFGISPAGVAAMIKSGKIMPIQIGRSKLVALRSILDIELKFDESVRKVERALIGIATRGESKVFYEPIMTPLGLSTSIPADRSYIGKVLGRISERSHRDHKFLLTVLVHRSTAGVTKPGPGFFDLARHLKYSVGDENDFVQEQTSKILKFYSK